MADVDVLHAGWATKRGNNVKNWKRRYFVLRSNCTLSYYVDSLAAMNKPKGMIKCNKYTQVLGPDSSACRSMQWPPETHPQSTFAVDMQGRTYFMFCKTPEEAEEWREHITAALKNPQQQQSASNNLITQGQVNRRLSEVSTFSVRVEESSSDDETSRRQTNIETETMVKQLIARNTSLLKRVEELEKELNVARASNRALKTELGGLQAEVHKLQDKLSSSVSIPRIQSDSEDDDDDDEDHSARASRKQSGVSSITLDAVLRIQRWWRQHHLRTHFLLVKDSATNRGRKRTMDRGGMAVIENDLRKQSFLNQHRRPTTTLDRGSHRLSMVLRAHDTISEEHGHGGLEAFSRSQSAGLTAPRVSAVSVDGIPVDRMVRTASNLSVHHRVSTVSSEGIPVDKVDSSHHDPPSSEAGKERAAEELPPRTWSVVSEVEHPMWHVADEHDPKCRPVRLAMMLFNHKPVKGVKKFVEDQLLESEPSTIAKFLVTEPGLSRSMVGEFLGDTDPLCTEVLESYAQTMDFENCPVDICLRLFLLGFRIPGEAQKIERVLSKFAERFHSCNPSLFQHQDTALVLAFSTMMLQTDLHNPSNPRKMTKAEFVRNNRGIDDGADVPAPFLEAIYDRIKHEEFQCTPDRTNQVANKAATISGKFREPLKQPWRSYIADCPVTELFKSKDPAPKRTSTLVLFNDLLLVCKGRDKHLTLREYFWLKDVKLRKAELATPVDGAVELIAADDPRRLLYRFQFINRARFISLLEEYIAQAHEWQDIISPPTSRTLGANIEATSTA